MRFKNLVLMSGIAVSSLLLKTQNVEAQVKATNAKPGTTINAGQKKIVDEKQQKENQVKADLAKYLGDDYGRLTQAGFKDFNVYITQDDKGAATLNIYTKKNATSNYINAEKDTIVVKSMAGFATSYSIGSENDKLDLSNTKKIDCLYDISTITTINKWRQLQTNAIYKILGDSDSAELELTQTEKSFGEYELSKASMKQQLPTDDKAITEMKNFIAGQTVNMNTITYEKLSTAFVTKFNEKKQESFLSRLGLKQTAPKKLSPEQLKKDSVEKVEMNKQINLELFNGDDRKSEKYRKEVMREYASKSTDMTFLKRVFGEEDYKRLSQIPGIKWAVKIQTTNNVKEYGSALQLVVDAYAEKMNQEERSALGISMAITDGIVGDTDNPPDGIFGELDYLQAKVVYAENKEKRNLATRKKETIEMIWLVMSNREYDFTSTSKMWPSAEQHLKIGFDKVTSQFQIGKRPKIEQVKQGASDVYIPVENGNFQPFMKLEAMQQAAKTIMWKHIDHFSETNELDSQGTSDFAVGVHLSTDGEPALEVAPTPAAAKSYHHPVKKVQSKRNKL